MRNNIDKNRTQRYNNNQVYLNLNKKDNSKSKSKNQFVLSKIQDDESNIKQQRNKKVVKSPERSNKSPERLNKSPKKIMNKSVQNLQNPRLYRPYERNVKQFENNKKNMYDELQNVNVFRITNTHSYFLNQKYPKAPIYERAQQIMRKRQQMLRSQRQRQVRQKQQQQQRQYQQMKAMQLQKHKRVLKKEEAYELTNKLYKDHYSKVNRLNLYKIQQQKEEAKLYREKPQINQTSREIYSGLMKKNKIQNNVIDRFNYYDQQKKQHQKDIENKINSKYYPFKPNISPSPIKLRLKDHSPSNYEKFQNKSSTNLKIKDQAS